MPSRAKLTTRGISTTTVTSETLPKNLPLTNNELDSNFLNLRDQTFSIVGDDSTGIDVRAGDTIKFAGAGGATVTASGDTITITAGGGGGGLGNLQVNDTTLSPITTNSNIKLEAHGTGEIELISQQITLGDSPVGGTVDLTTASAHQLTISINNNVNSSRIEIIPSGGIFLNPNGSEQIKIDNNYWPNTDGTNGQTLITDGAGNLSWSSLSGAQGITFVGDDSTGTRISDGETVKIAGGTGITTAMSGDVLTITATGSASTGDLTIVGSEISGPSNGDISITPGGTGNVVLKTETLRIGDPDVATEGDVINIFTATDQSLYIATSNLDSNSASIKLIEESGNERIELAIPSSSNKGIYLIDENIVVGRAGSSKYLTSNGSGFFYLQSGEDINNGYILLTPGANSNIAVSPAGTGNFVASTNKTQLGKIGDLTTAVLTTYNTRDLTLNTFDGTNSGTITITNGVNGNIAITPNGTGSVVLDGLSYPQSDGSNGQVLTTNGAGILSWTTATAQGITFVGDDSTGTRISDNETVKIAGTQNITTAVSGDTVTITGPNLTGYAQKTDTAITIVGDDSTGTAVTLGETFKIAGGTGITTAVGADTLFINATSTSSVGDFTITGTTISAETTNADITITSTGTGNLNVNMDTLRIGDSGSESNITTNGTGSLVLSTNNVGVNSSTIKINEGTNGNIAIAPNGTGKVVVGDSNADATITTNGTGDIIINTNSGTNSGVIKIADGSAGKISIIPNTTGRVDLGHEAETTTNFPTALTSDLYNVDNAKIRGTSRFFSKLDYAPYTSADDQLLPHHDYVALKTNGGSFDSANIRNEAARHAIVFDLNGASTTATTTNTTSSGVRAQSSQLIYKNSAGGTKTGFNINTNGNFAQVMAGHGGALTIPRMVGYVNDFNVGGNTGETTTITDAWAFRDQGPQYSGTGTTGTERVITNYHSYETGVSYPSSTNTPWAFYVRSTSQNWRSRIGAVDLPKRWPVNATHSSGGAYTVNFQTTGHGFHVITLTSNITSFTMSNFPTSTAQICEFDLVFIQDGTGGRTISFTPTGSEVFKFRNGTNTLADSTAAPEILHAKVFTRYDGTKTIFYWDIDNREYV